MLVATLVGCKESGAVTPTPSTFEVELLDIDLRF